MTAQDHIDAAKAALAPYVEANPKATQRGHIVPLLQDLLFLVGEAELRTALDLAWIKVRADQHKEFVEHAQALGFWQPDPVPFNGVVGHDGKATITLP